MESDTLIKFSELFWQLVTELFFQGHTPSWLSSVIQWTLLLIVILLAVWGFLFILSQIIKIWKEQVKPTFYDQVQRRRLLRRQRFAEFIVQEIRQLNNREDWKDYRFTELEAEVEAEGKRLRGQRLPFVRASRRGLRREKSLSKALEVSIERLILVEGDPGAGKSIALRHVTEKLAQRASKDKSINSVIPLYINLKKLSRPTGSEVNRHLIEEFIKQELNHINDRDVDQFLNDEFQAGLQEGSWLFLFDSFDELPEVLSSVEADETIRNYAQAIDDFLSGFNTCRGIIASRHFRGPRHLGWPLFRVLPLESKRWELIRKADLESDNERKLIQKLAIASSEIQEITKNPMFLGILCEDMRAGSEFPANTHSMLEHYFETRLARDKERLLKKYQLRPEEVRAAAERIAFCMTVDAGLGLSPPRNRIRTAMNRHNFDYGLDLERSMNALEYLKLARSDMQGQPGDSRIFTFAHRRFQEYFATCIVLTDFTQISPRQLLKDGRWRETAVVILQTQPPNLFIPLLTEASSLLQEMIESIPDLIPDPLVFISSTENKTHHPAPQLFSWPDGLLPLMSLLQDGLIGRIDKLPSNAQHYISRTLLTASSLGNLADAKWSLEVAGIAAQPVLLYLLRRAFASDSQWLKEVAFRQTGRLNKVPDDVAAGIRNSLTRTFFQRRLNKEYLTIHAHLSRLDNAPGFINTLNLLSWIDPIDICLHLAVIGFFLWASMANWGVTLIFLTPLSISLVLLLWRLRQPVKELYSGVNLSLRFILFPLLWYSCAIIAAETGLFNEIFWWPFLLFFPLLYFSYICANPVQLSK